jgi:hypothetical protein
MAEEVEMIRAAGLGECQMRINTNLAYSARPRAGTVAVQSIEEAASDEFIFLHSWV